MYSTDVLSYAVFFSSVIGSQTAREAEGDIPFVSKFACEHQMANLECPSNKIIEIHSLFYGRNRAHGDGICLSGHGARQEACEMTGFDKEEKLRNLKKACNGKTNCNILASDITFGDRQKCPNVTKYLNIIYKCPLPPLSSTSEPSTKEPVYYTGTSRPGSTSNKATPEPYMDLHKMDEDGKEWPKPRPRVQCNPVNESSDDVDFNSAASSLEPCLSFVLAIFFWKLFP